MTILDAPTLILLPVEDWLREDFWRFLRERGLDRRESSRTTPPTRPKMPVLDDLEERIDCLTDRYGQRGDATFFMDDRWPRLYTTLQEALSAYLIYRLADAEEGFPYGYSTWLRVIVRVLADTSRDPDTWLTVQVKDYSREEFDDPDEKPVLHGEYIHRMKIDDNWSVMSRDTFETLRKTYGRKRRRSKR